MAIYDTGTASLAANGQVTGVGTQWTMPLTLIRVGATLVFKTEPVQIYTISEITSDTSMAVYNPNGETVPAGTGYAILAHDGISVQGLAQDVAETLRYYQSRETEVADAVDAFNNFDSADFESKVNQVNAQHGDVVSIGAQVSSYASQVSADKDAAYASSVSSQNSANLAEAAANSVSGALVVSFESGGTIESPTQPAVYKSGDSEVQVYYWKGDLPKVVPSNSSPSSTGGIGQNSWSGVSDFELRTNEGASLIKSLGGDSVQDYINECLYVDSFQDAIELTSVDESVNRISTLRYYKNLPDGAFHTPRSGNLFVRNGSGVPGDNDGGSYFVTSDGTKWQSILPLHVDAFGACGGVPPVSFDSGPAFQRAIISASRGGFSPGRQLNMSGPVYTINSKVLWPSNVTIKGDQTTIVSSSNDYIFESAYYPTGGTIKSNWGLTDNQLLADGIITDSKFLNTAFISVRKVFRLRGFTFGCSIGGHDKCVTFNNCGVCVDAELSFYSFFSFFVRGDNKDEPNNYATIFGHQCNLNKINVTYAGRPFGAALSQASTAERPRANMQLPDFTGSSFEGITGIGVLLRGTTYGVKLDGIYVENTKTLVQKDSGNFLTYGMSLNNNSWSFGVNKLISIAGARDINLTLSNQSGDYPSVEIVSAPGLENTGTINIEGSFGLTYPKFYFNILDDIKLKFRYDFRGSEVVRSGDEFYVRMPNVGYEKFNYLLKASGSGYSITKSGFGYVGGVTSIGETNSYVTQDPSGDIIIHFTGLSATSYPWIDSADKVVSVWS